jgi:transcriptional regulator with XRE-family HTH domain
MTLATMIRKARERSRLSLRRVAELASCSPSHLSRLETGQLAPSRKLLLRLSGVLGLDFDVMQIAMGIIPDDLAEWLTSNPRAMSKLRRMQRSAAA